MTDPESNPQKRIEIYTHEPMVNWLDAGQLLDAGIRALVAGTFGTFADSRLIQAALNPPASNPPLVVDKKGPIWIDYVADTADGWDSTYSVAWSISRDTLSVPGIREPMPRADLLVFGGDQVYPTPANNGYRTRFLDPYGSAFPADIPPATDMSDAPTLLAIPGNHDWYDGLAGFTQTFCSQRPIGRWKTVQHTSYFAVKLPHGWWFWGLDLQLESQIDHPQYKYFQWILENHVQAGDRVVLITPEPSWIEESERRQRDDEIVEKAARAKTSDSDRSSLRKIVTQNPRFASLNKVEQLIADDPKPVTVAAVLTGDQHLYAHYLPDTNFNQDAPHRITCGGGGAYLLGTHDLPATLNFKSGGGDQEYTLGATFPDAATSRTLRNQMWKLPLKNPMFCGLLAAIYLLYVWLLQSASKVPNKTLYGTSLMEYLARFPLSLKGAFTTLPNAVLAVLAHSPASVLLTLLIVGGCAAYTAASVKSDKLVPALGGAVHGLLHLTLALLLLWCMSRFNLGWLSVDSPWQVLLLVAETAVVGGGLGGVLFGGWIVLTNARWRWHGEDAFSAQSIADYKSFLRLRIDNTGLTIYPLKIAKVCRHWDVGKNIEVTLRAGNTWRLRAKSGDGARFVPRDPIQVELIEPPLHIPATGKVQR
jgi:hypothetical protein